MSEIPSPPLQMESLARCLGGCIFSCSRWGCMFFFLYPFWYIVGKFGLSVKTWRRELGCLQLCFFLSKRVSLCSRKGFFCYTIAYFVQFWFIKNRVTKINFMYFNGNCGYSSCFGWSIQFLYAPAHKSLDFWKKLSFQLVYLCIFVWF